MFRAALWSALPVHPQSGFLHTNKAWVSRLPGVVKPHAEQRREVFGAGTVGRRRDGRWLDGTPRAEQPAFGANPQGRITPLDAHVRKAAPDRRNPPPLVRRGYNYHRSTGFRARPWPNTPSPLEAATSSSRRPETDGSTPWLEHERPLLA